MNGWGQDTLQHKVKPCVVCTPQSALLLTQHILSMLKHKTVLYEKGSSAV